MPKHRVISTTKIGFADSTVTTNTIWQGTDTDELSRKFPPSEIFGADPLGHSEIEDGFIRTDFHFEKQAQDGSWEKCSDPRRRITPVTTLEREIDAENRRLFPGDFGLADDDQDDFQCCGGLGCSACDPYWDQPEEDDLVSTGEVLSRAYAHFGNSELAREAAEMYPGDFI